MITLLLFTLLLFVNVNALDDSLLPDDFEKIPPPARAVPHVGPYTGQPWEDDIFLPRDVEPLHYDLYLYPNLEDKTLTGKLNIWIKTTTEKKYLYLHSKYLKHEKLSKLYEGKVPLGGEGDATEAVRMISNLEYKPHEFLVVEAESVIPPGEYTWHFEFVGSIHNPEDPLNGFYYSEYLDGEGNVR